MLNHVGDQAAPLTIAVVRNISERKQLQESLTQARDSAIRANEVKSRFLAAASHDLRQPLQTIWSLQSVLANALQDSTLGPALGLLKEAVRSMDEILSALIDVNRLEQGAIQPVIRDFSLSEILLAYVLNWAMPRPASRSSWILRNPVKPSAAIRCFSR